MTGKRVSDAFKEIKKLRSDIKGLKFAVMTTAVALLTSMCTLTYIISQM